MYNFSILNAHDFDADIMNTIKTLYDAVTTTTFNDTDIDIDALVKTINEYVDTLNTNAIYDENERLTMYHNDAFVSTCAHSTYIETTFKVVTNDTDSDKNGVSITQKRVNMPFKSLNTENAVEFSNHFTWLFNAFQKSVFNGQTISRSALKKSILPHIDSTVTIDTLASAFVWLFSKSTNASIGKKSITVKINQSAFCNGVLNSIRAVNGGLTATYKTVTIDR